MLRVDRTTAHRDINIAIYQKRDGERSNYTTKVVCTNFEPKRDKIKVPRPIQPILLEKPSVGAAYRGGFLNAWILPSSSRKVRFVMVRDYYDMGG